VVPPNIGATNSTGFNALGGGYRDPSYYDAAGSVEAWWTSTEFIDAVVYTAAATVANSQIDGRAYGFNIRCVMDGPPPPHLHR